jgi:glycolate oxidase FAD binding subunit
MILRPANREDLAASLRAAHHSRAPVKNVDLGCLRRVLEYTPEDMTVTVEAGLPLADLQSVLARSGQWLPVDPPHPECLTIRALLDTNASGPRRYGHGTIRDHLIGLRVVLPDGRIVHSGGKVVKNVAGYDLMKLFIGAHGSLGVIVEAAFKLLPLPETEQFVQTQCQSLDEAGRRIESVFNSSLTPVVIDLHNLSATLALVLGFAGPREDVTWQVQEAAKLGVAAPATLGYVATFHEMEAPALQCASVLPSRVVGTLERLGPVPFVARAGNGVVYHRGGFSPPEPALPGPLFDRVKATFDPNGIFQHCPVMSKPIAPPS